MITYSLVMVFGLNTTHAGDGFVPQFYFIEQNYDDMHSSQISIQIALIPVPSSKSKGYHTVQGQPTHHGLDDFITSCIQPETHDV